MLPAGKTLAEALEARGLTRRDFMRFAAGMTAMLALPPRYAKRIAEALLQTARPALVWLEFQDCAGNSESMLRSSHPTIAELVLESLSWEYHELLMAGAGRQAQAQLERVVREQKGKYLAVVEGAIPLADGGVYCTIGGRTAADLVREVCSSAAATLAIGACAWDGGRPMEVGPLARMLVAHASGQRRVGELVRGALADLDLGPQALFSTFGRVTARAIETQYLVEQLKGWLDELRDNMARGEVRAVDSSRWRQNTWPATASGAGFVEAPRGALGHWVNIENGTIRNYQAVVPSTWNGSPRDAQGQRGPLEAALVGTPVAELERPLEILRTIHSFDPCIACAVHVLDPSGRERVRVAIEHDH